MKMNEKLITIKEVAKLIGVHTETLYRWRKARKHLPFISVDSSIRYRLSDIENFIEKRLITPIN
jgi:excisionase family DNA binding protein